MNSTYTINEDKNIHASYEDNALRKRQFTMDMCFNAGEGDQRDSYVSLVCKGVFNGRRKKVEQLALDKRVSILFKKCLGRYKCGYCIRT